MWRRKEELMVASLPARDAPELAEKEELMLEPEADMPENRLGEALPEHVVEEMKRLGLIGK
jgi:hypothetical protein